MGLFVLLDKCRVSVCRQRAVSRNHFMAIPSASDELWFRFLEHKVAYKEMWGLERHFQAKLFQVLVTLMKLWASSSESAPSGSLSKGIALNGFCSDLT